MDMYINGVVEKKVIWCKEKQVYKLIFWCGGSDEFFVLSFILLLSTAMFERSRSVQPGTDLSS